MTLVYIQLQVFFGDHLANKLYLCTVGTEGAAVWGCLQVFLFLYLTLWGVRWGFKLRFHKIGKGLCDLTYSPAEECDMFRQKKEPSVINIFNCLGVGVGGEGVV